MVQGRELLTMNAEELVDVLSCYFPVVFTPPPNDPHGITQAMLASRLLAPLTASPVLAPYVIPLILEKLSSSHRLVHPSSIAGLFV